MATSSENFYEGEQSSFNSMYGNYVGYRMNTSGIGFPGSAQTANQLGEVVNAIKQGTKTFEVTMVSPEAAEQIPKQHFNEMRALMKLTGVKPSVHGPIIDPAGFGERGWDGDVAREDNERRMFGTIEKAHELDPKGNVPIVFHSSAVGVGPEYRRGKDGEFIKQKGFAVNRETGQLAPLKREYKFRPEFPKLLEKGAKEGEPAGKLFSAEKQIGSANLSEWENKLTDIAQMTKHADEVIGSAPIQLQDLRNAGIGDDLAVRDLATGEELFSFKDIKDGETQLIARNYNQIRKAGIFLENAELAFAGAFHQAYKYGTPKQKKELKALAEVYSKGVSEFAETGKGDHVVARIWGPIEKKQLLDDSIERLKMITNRDTPQVFQDVEEFSMEKAATTFGNLASKSYKKFKENSPVIAIENMFPGFSFSKADDMKMLVEKSRENFAKHLVEKEGLRKKEADEIAEKQIGITWDVGHLNVIKKQGFSDEDIVKETQKVAKMVKHIHLTDNFGYGDSHLAPGMGNVPFKEILKELEKTGRLDEMRKIVEAPGFIQHFKKLPHGMTLAAFNSGIYGAKMGATWGEAMDIQGSYFGGYGKSNPELHQSMYGAGFTTMPVELGGVMPGGQSRFGGTPMA
ncbi:MAG: TIM barrel protein [archaeon]